MTASPLIPVVVVTGFLGSGKTTLLNAVLRRRAELPQARKLALIVNELGAVGVDGDLLPTGGVAQIELPGGCVCCVLSTELDAGLLRLANEIVDLEMIVIETTGVAEPIGIAWTLEGDDLRERFRLAAVVTLVDATYFLEAERVSPAAVSQVRYADVLALTKAELVDAATAARVRARASELAPHAPWVTGDANALAAWFELLLAEPPVREGGPSLMSAPHGERPAPLVAPDAGPGYAHAIQSVAVDASGELDLEALIDAIAALPSAVVRVKGIVHARDQRTGDDRFAWYAVHRVGARVSTEPLDAPHPARLVALGTEVDAGALAACVTAARLS